ncbi:amino acid adenylation domain-containing protein [Streptomyces sp. NPDC056956]|uniref:non-ribosomal peptide synthetase n=2 Tax=unclassified Streptomyces TaxID=2593676 RepID=UPI003640CD4B
MSTDQVYVMPASPSQLGLWLLSELEPTSSAYHVPLAVRLTGPLDPAALEEAVRLLGERHEILRTTFGTADGEVSQFIHPAPAWRMEHVALDHLTPEAAEEACRDHSAARAFAPFDLAAGPLLRPVLYRLADDDHVLLLALHHIVTDGWSTGVIAAELSALYRHGADALPAPALQYADFAVWHRDWLAGGVAARQLDHWRADLADDLALDLPTDHPRPARPARGGDRVTGRLPEHLTRRLRELAASQGTSLFAALHAAFAATLSRYSGQSEVRIGVPAAGRGHANTEDLIGFFANTLVVRTGIDRAQGFRALLGEVRTRLATALDHADVPFRDVVQALGHGTDRTAPPLFQAMVAEENMPQGFDLAPGLRAERFDVPNATAKFDLTLFVADTPGQGAGLTLEYSTELFTEQTAERLLDAVLALATNAVHHPDRALRTLTCVSVEDQVRLSGWSRGGPAVDGGTTALDLFHRQAATAGDDTAAVEGDIRVTYAELDRRAGRVAAALLAAGVRPGQVVGVLLPRSVDLVAALLGAWKCGASYLALDATQPAERLAALLRDAGAAALVATGERARDIAGGTPVVDVDALPGQPAPRTPGAGDTAYVLYTSGSTGRPKGVVVPHRGLANYLRWAADAYSPGRAPVAPVHSSVAFDLTVTSLWLPLTAGGTIHLVDEADPLDGLVSVLTGPARPTLVKLTPSHLQALCRLLPEGGLADLDACFVVGGEALSPVLVDQFRAVAPAATVVNEYGPTETVVGCAVHILAPGEAVPDRPGIPAGRPIAGTCLYVLDERMVPVPVGVPGELFIGGVQVAWGYLGDPVKTAGAFVPDPFGAVPGARLYRTGDVVRYLPGGELEFLGRRDHQVKIRGQRIELGEVENALRAVAEITDAVVVSRTDGAGQLRLVGYVTGGAGAEHVRQELARTLPEAMVPSAVVCLDVLPLTANGKVDRAALPEPEFGSGQAAYRAPESDVERRVAALFGEVLGVDQVGLDDDFFDLGGHSLLATQLIARIRSDFDVQLPLRALFEASDVAGVSASVVAAGRVEALPELRRVERAGPLPLSFAQQRMWFLHQLDPDGSSYNVPAAVRLTGALDVERLRGALLAVAARHEVLRTRFEAGDTGPVQVVDEEPAVGFEARDLSGEADPAAVALGVAHEVARLPFDLVDGPLMRVVVMRTGDTEHVLALSMHHIVSDGWSVGVLLREIQAAYAGQELPALAVQYADYAAWQREWLSGEVLQEQLGYWREALKGAPPALDLPTDRPRPAVPSHRGTQLAAVLDADVVSRLAGVARERGATLFGAIQSVVAAVLSRRAGQDDVVIGVPVANRSRVETEELIGFFVNTLPLRTQVSGEESFLDLVGRVGGTAVEALSHQDVPFERLVQELVPDRDRSRNPLFQVMCALQNAPTVEQHLDGVEMTHLPVSDGTAKFDLMLVAEEAEDGGLSLTLEYSTDLFFEATARAVLDDVLRACRAAVADPARPVRELTEVSEAERDLLLHTWNATDRTDRLDCLVTRVRQLAVEQPDAVAVSDDRGEVTYAELAGRASRLSGELLAAGVGLDDRVVYHGERGIDAVVSLLGVLGAGGVYVPLDLRAPAARNAHMTSACGARWIVAEPGTADAARALAEATDARPEVVLCPQDGAAVDGPPVPGAGDDLAYVLFTSGSTGLPKGAMVHRAGMNNHLLAKVDDLALTGADVVVQNAALTFDISVWQMVAALVVGGRTAVYGDETALDATGLFVRAERDAVTVLEVVPSLLRAALDAWDTVAGSAPGLADLRKLVVTGEALPPDLCARWFARYPGIEIVNAYGPTECSDDVTHATLTAEVDRVPIGSAVRNTRLYVLDEAMHPVPVGVRGELFVGGVGVGRGYLDDPVKTASAFVPDPFGAVPGARLYRTGDVVRYLPGGELEFLGRRDHQVKIRGQRIELGEVENALRALPEVTDAVVLDRPHPSGATALVGYVVGGVDTADLRAGLTRALPEAMIPSVLIRLDAMPLTANGKVDRAALPEPEFGPGQAAYRAPESDVERRVAALFGEVLGAEQVGLDDDFFDLGGHSLLATQLIARIRSDFDVQLPLRALFEASDVAGVSASVVAAGRVEALPELRRVERAGPLPLSFAQQRMWFLHQLDPDSAFYNVPAAVRLTGELDVERLRGALLAVAARHEVLRTRFEEQAAGPVQIVGEEPAVGIEIRDLSGAADPDAAALGVAHEVARLPFDLVDGPLMRVVVMRVRTDEHVLALSMHHIVSDGWSVGVLLRDLQAAYDGRELPGLAVQYADYAAWQRDWLSGDVLEEQLAYWREALQGAPPALDLPTDRPRPAVPSHRGAQLAAVLDSDVVSRLAGVARERGATLFGVVQSVLSAVLSRRAGQDDVVIGVPVANRSRVETEELIGFFVNTLPLRTRISGEESFLDLVARVGGTAVEALSHQDVPFERLVQELVPDRDRSRNPLFQVMLAFQNAPHAVSGPSGVRLEQLALEETTAKFDLMLVAEETEDGGLSLTLEYSTDLFFEATARAVLDDVLRACRAAADDPARPVRELTEVSEAERELLLHTWNATDRTDELTCLVGRVRELAVSRPNAVAVTDDEGAVTYAELAGRASRLSGELLAAGVGLDDRVVYHGERGIDAVVTLLGVLGAGGVYVPLDLRAPAARNAHMTSACGARWIVAPPALADAARVLANAADSGPQVLVCPRSGDAPDELVPLRGAGDDLAYVLFTSGSTGLPKGAMVHRAGMNNHLLAKVDDLALTGADVVVQNAALTFDISVWQMMAALVVGGRTAVYGDETALDATGLFVRAERDAVTVLEVVPSLLRAALDAWDTVAGSAPGLADLRKLVVTGEALPPDLCARWFARYPGIEIVNAYGPTECSDDVTHATLTAEVDRVPIGSAVRNTRLYVLDEAMHPVPVGVRGELFVGGVGVGRGYLDDPVKTASAFVPDPFGAVPGARLYRTGDVVRYLPGGELEFLGRRDHQVKIRGQRIELGEVENALRALPEVTDAVVVSRIDGVGQLRLVGYVTGTDGAERIRQELARTLPEAMVPSAVVCLDEMPLTANGKVDRAALPEPGLQAERTVYRAPRTLDERLLADLFAEVLGVERVGLDDDFFDLGGHSLLATQLIARIRSDFDVQLPLRTLFETPVVEALAAEIAALVPSGGQDGDRASGVEALLAEIEHLSDEEAEALLSQVAADAPAPPASGPEPVAAAPSAADPAPSAPAASAPAASASAPSAPATALTEPGDRQGPAPDAVRRPHPSGRI